MLLGINSANLVQSLTLVHNASVCCLLYNIRLNQVVSLTVAAHSLIPQCLNEADLFPLATRKYIICQLRTSPAIFNTWKGSVELRYLQLPSFVCPPNFRERFCRPCLSVEQSISDKVSDAMCLSVEHSKFISVLC